MEKQRELNKEAAGLQKRKAKKAEIFTISCVERNFIPLHIRDEFPL